MLLRQMRYFVTVVECNSFTEAAEKSFLRNYCMFWKKDRSSYYIEEFAEILHRLLETAQGKHS